MAALNDPTASTVNLVSQAWMSRTTTMSSFQRQGDSQKGSLVSLPHFSA